MFLFAEVGCRLLNAQKLAVAASRTTPASPRLPKGALSPLFRLSADRAIFADGRNVVRGARHSRPEAPEVEARIGLNGLRSRLRFAEIAVILKEGVTDLAALPSSDFVDVSAAVFSQLASAAAAARAQRADFD